MVIDLVRSVGSANVCFRINERTCVANFARVLILKLGTTLSSNQPTKAVPWSFGAPTFTNKKLLDN